MMIGYYHQQNCEQNQISSQPIPNITLFGLADLRRSYHTVA